MDWHHAWWILAIALVILEISTGTFYLLVLAAAAALAALVAGLGFGDTAQVMVASISAVGGVVALYFFKRARGPRPAKMQNNLDVGQSVEVLAWLGPDEGRARVFYRGTQWDARLVDLNAPRQQHMQIVGSEASTLLIAPLGGAVSTQE